MDCHETWVIYTAWKTSYVNEVKGHVPRSEVIWYHQSIELVFFSLNFITQALANGMTK